MEVICVAGDYFSDEFNTGYYRGNGPRFVVENTITRPGGAANTLANARAICSNTATHCFHAGHSSDKVLKRWVEQDRIVFEHWHTETSIFEDPWACAEKKTPAWYAGFEYKTLIVSEYDKGFKNYEVPNLSFDLLVVDSRYRTAPIEQLKHLAKVRIWRCTGTEYDAKWAKHFDYVVHTNHDGNILISETWMTGPPVVIKVPPAVDTDPVGAGDTFTAALAAYLTHKREASWDTLPEACKFGIQAAQNVCAKRFTATTDVKLES